MITADQTAVIGFLESPSTHGGAAVERIDTHASVVFLAGDHAYKLKRAVKYDYLDFSTLDRRHALCNAEVRLNRRTAPQLYRGLIAVTRQDDGSLALGGTGAPVEWLVEMNRFPQEMLFDRLADRGALSQSLMPSLAAAIADFHRSAEPRLDAGGQAGMSWVIDGNAAGLAEFGRAYLDPVVSSRVTAACRREVARNADLLDRRRRSGFVRQCHGDLHLRNIVLLDGSPTLFDAVEFNDDIACIDVMYDLAFLLTDLWRRRLPLHANALWNRYLWETGDLEGAALMPLFLGCRAAVRAKTSATAATFQRDPRRRDELQSLAGSYLAMADALLCPPGPVLVAVGGVAGSGKSTLALRLAPALGGAPGAVVLRSDEIRKRLLGVPPLQRLDGDGYSPQISDQVYATIAEQADRILRAGHSVIVDAVHARPADRMAIERVAAGASVPVVGFWLDAPDDVLIARVEQRAGDPSDARADVVRAQRALDTGPITWWRVDASGSEASIHAAVLSCIGHRLPVLNDVATLSLTTGAADPSRRKEIASGGAIGSSAEVVR